MVAIRPQLLISVTRL